MFARSVKNFVVFIFLFTVLEKTGCDILFSLTRHSEFDVFAKVVETESSKENESKEKSLKEYWICTEHQSLAALLQNNAQRRNLIKKVNAPLSFYPAVPTPPPNHLAI